MREDGHIIGEGFSAPNGFMYHSCLKVTVYHVAPRIFELPHCCSCFYHFHSDIQIHKNRGLAKLSKESDVNSVGIEQVSTNNQTEGQRNRLVDLYAYGLNCNKGFP